MSWTCPTCDESHPDHFRFCPVSGEPRPSPPPPKRRAVLITFVSDDYEDDVYAVYRALKHFPGLDKIIRLDHLSAEAAEAHVGGSAYARNGIPTPNGE